MAWYLTQRYLFFLSWVDHPLHLIHWIYWIHCISFISSDLVWYELIKSSSLLHDNIISILQLRHFDTNRLLKPDRLEEKTCSEDWSRRYRICRDEPKKGNMKIACIIITLIGFTMANETLHSVCQRKSCKQLKLLEGISLDNAYDCTACLSLYHLEEFPENNDLFLSDCSKEKGPLNKMEGRYFCVGHVDFKSWILRKNYKIQSALRNQRHHPHRSGWVSSIVRFILGDVQKQN